MGPVHRKAVPERRGRAGEDLLGHGRTSRGASRAACADPDLAAELCSSAYLRLLVLAALIGVPVAAAAYCSAAGAAMPVHEPPRAVGWAATAERRRFGAPALAVSTSRSRRWIAEDTASAG